MRAFVLVLLVSAMVAAAPAARAQDNPSADDMIKSLKLHRGIKAAPSVSLALQFASNSAELTPQAASVLDELGRALSSPGLSHDRFRIEGHTDTVGSPKYNKALSQRRANAVAAYLEQKFAIPPARLRPVGFGQEGLAVPTPPQTDNAENRRVRVVNLGG
jgi:outer membrane protein OmpA-like peptidoglycan-associated protein